MRVMMIREVENKEAWEGFLAACEEKTFLQAFNWGTFRRAMGERVWRLGVYHQEGLAALAQVMKIKARRGTFLFLPHGPIIRTQSSKHKPQNHSVKLKTEVLTLLLGKLRDLAKQEKASFIRVAPVWERNRENQEIFKGLGFRPSPLHMHPEVTWELALTPSEQDLLRMMRKTTRYLIRQGLKHQELKILKSSDISALEKFNHLYQETARRHHFVPFSLAYLQRELDAFGPDNQALVFLAQYKGEVLAGAVIVFWQEMAFYHHGASSQTLPKIPASYLLQWEAIREAKQRGCQRYNFWGIVDEAATPRLSTRKRKHPWAGLTLFKQGFGGYKKEYLKTQDFILSQRYWLNFGVEKIRRRKRNL